MTPREFAAALLDRLGFPNNQNNIVSIVAWEALEGGHWPDTEMISPDPFPFYLDLSQHSRTGLRFVWPIFKGWRLIIQ